MTENGFEVTISCILFRNPSETIDSMLKLASKYGAKIRFGQLDYVGRAKFFKKEEVLLNKTDERQFAMHVAELKLKKPELFGEKISGLENEQMRYSGTFMQDNKKRCPMAFGAIDILWDGTIKPCSLPIEYFEKLDKAYVGLNALNEPDLTSSAMYKKVSNIWLSSNEQGPTKYHCVLFGYKERGQNKIHPVL